jgi:hypothetical protein
MAVGTTQIRRKQANDITRRRHALLSVRRSPSKEFLFGLQHGAVIKYLAFAAFDKAFCLPVKTGDWTREEIGAEVDKVELLARFIRGEQLVEVHNIDNEIIAPD